VLKEGQNKIIKALHGDTKTMTRPRAGDD